MKCSKLYYWESLSFFSLSLSLSLGKLLLLSPSISLGHALNSTQNLVQSCAYPSSLLAPQMHAIHRSADSYWRFGTVHSLSSSATPLSSRRRAKYPKHLTKRAPLLTSTMMSTCRKHCGAGSPMGGSTRFNQTKTAKRRAASEQGQMISPSKHATIYCYWHRPTNELTKLPHSEL